MSVIRIRAVDAASALNEVARRFGSDALILSTTQNQGFVEVSIAQPEDGTAIPLHMPVGSAAEKLPDLPSRLILLGPPGAGVSMLAARLAARHLQLKRSGNVHLIAARPDMLAPTSPLIAHARLLGLEVGLPIVPDGSGLLLAAPQNHDVQIVDLSGLRGRGSRVVRSLLSMSGAACWLVLPTGLHLQAQDRIVPVFRDIATAIALTRQDICPLTLEDRALPQRFGLPIAMVSQGLGLLEALRMPDHHIAESATLDQKDALHAAARLSQ